MPNPVTPRASKAGHLKSPTSSSQKKLKQASLLSFFSKQTSPLVSKTKSTVLKSDKGDLKIDSVNEKSAQDKKLFVAEDDDESDVKDKSMQTNGSKSDIPTSATPFHEPKSLSPTGVIKSETASSDSNQTLLKSVKKDFAHAKSDNEDDEEENLTLSISSRRKKRPVSYAEDSGDDDDSALSSRKKKSRASAKNDDSDDDEFVPSKKTLSDVDDDDIEFKDEDVAQELVSENDDTFNSDDDELIQLGKNSVRKSPTPKPKKSNFASNLGLVGGSNRKSSPPKMKHSNFNKQNEERYQWLVEIRDAQKRSITDPEYDPRTLYIPPPAWNKFTAFEKQYWEIKSKMWDCVVFFKKGKFFELYEKDAILGHTLFDLKLAGGGRANMQLAGIPEMSFDFWASQFIQYGYKVAKVDQKESMLAKEMREGSKGIVQRELECVLTSGTLTEGNMLHSDLATYCLAVKEEPGNYYSSNDSDILTMEETFSKKIFGVAFIDTATGQIQLIEFEDDSECTKLDTLLSQIKPKEIIMEKNCLSSLAQKIIKFNSASQAIFNYMRPKEEFYDFEKTCTELLHKENNYFKSIEDWPPILQKFHSEKKEVGLSAFGGLLHYLKWLKLDQNMVSLGNIHEYNLVKSQNSMVLDGVTLQNLEIFGNSFDGSDKGTLFKLLNKAVTPMGKRMMRTWVIHPLLQKEDIEKRLDSVDRLLLDFSLKDDIVKYLLKLPDLERLLSKVHSATIKMKNFDNVILGFENIVRLMEKLHEKELPGALKIYLSQIPKSMPEIVHKWTNAFDRVKAVRDDVMVPHKGFEPEFDLSLKRITDLEERLNEILHGYRKQFKSSSIQYKDSGKEIYTIEVPMAVTKLIPANWVQMGANKSSKRYYSDEVSKLARMMAEAKEMHKTIEQDLKGRMCKKFDSDYSTIWMPTIQAISNVDCLISLAVTSEALGFPSCRPTFVDDIDPKSKNKLNGHMSFKSLRHPCFGLDSTSEKEFIPNDVELGKNVPQLGLLTGANAAGKSTVLRMTCIAVILAQLGCHVPCESATLTPVDRIMTRLGANDNIMQGKSTFFVELSETKKILDLATNRSLLVIDELGRGGSSNDGFAIAESVLYHIATHIQSLGFFATHYGLLGRSFIGHRQVKPLKMSILVDNDTRNVTFLYKLVEGQSEGSFGMHVASMCGISKEIVDNAQIAADNHEHTTKINKLKKKTFEKLNMEEVDVPTGLTSDFVRLAFGSGLNGDPSGTGDGVLQYDQNVKGNVLKTLFEMVSNL